MKALVLKENAKLEYSDVPMPEKPGEGFYLIRVAAGGICGSDIHRGFENGAYHYPLIMGHEFSGIVEEAPKGGKFSVGGRVVVFPLLWCGKCAACQTGDYAQCSSYGYFGSRQDGGFAEFVWVPEPNLFPVPEQVDILYAAMTEPCAVALHGVRKFCLKGGETAVVYGGGPIGNMVAQWLRVLGCGMVIVVEMDERKLETADGMGFSTLNPKEREPVGAMMDLTGGSGAVIAVDACGLPLTYLQALQSVGEFGEVLLLGNPSGDLLIPRADVSSILRREIRIHGTWNSKPVPRGRDDWTTVLEHLDKDISVAPLISHTPPLAEGPDIFYKIAEKKAQFSKVIFRIMGSV
jgi:L-iditol 2-dehydrogenase